MSNIVSKMSSRGSIAPAKITDVSQPCHFVNSLKLKGGSGSSKVIDYGIPVHINVTLKTLAIIVLDICRNLINPGHSSQRATSELWDWISHFKEEETWVQDVAELGMEFCFLRACWHVCQDSGYYAAASNYYSKIFPYL